MLLAALLAAGFSTQCYAAGEYMTISYPNDDSVLVISGNSGKQENLSIRVLALGEDGEDFVSGGSLKLDITAEDIKDNPGMLDYFNVTQSDAAGNYTFKYKTEGISGFYLFTVTDSEGRQETKAYEYYSPSFAKEKIELLNTYIKAKDIENISAFLKRYTEPLAADNEYFEKLKAADKLSGMTELMAEGGEVKDKADLKARVRIASVIETMKSLNLPEQNTDLISMLTHFSEFGFADDKLFTDTLQKTAAEDVKNNILKDIAALTAANDAEFKEKADSVILLGAVNYSAWGKIMSVLDENSDLFKNGAGFKALSDNKKASAAKVIAENVSKAAYTKLDDLDEDLKKAVDAQKNSTQGGGGGGGSSSSGGGSSKGSGGSSISAIGKVTEPAKDDTKTDTKKSFGDLTAAEWAREAVEALAEKGVVSGKSENEFAPNDPVTREEFLAMAMRAFGLMVDSAACEFSDVPENAWYYKAVASAYKRGITSGVSESVFGAGAKITRQDMCTIACKAADAAGINIGNESALNFADNDMIAEYAKESVGRMSGSGIVKGMDETRFEPLENATRAAAARIIYELLKLI